MAGTLNKGSLVKGTGGSGGGGSASFPTVVTDSGSSLPSASGYQLNDTFLNTSDKKIYKTELVNYSLASDITNVGSLDVSTNEISGFSSTKYLRTERYDTTINNIDFHFKTGDDVSTSQTLLIQGRKLSFSALSSIQISNKRLQIDSSYVYDNILANTEYHLKGYISKNNDDNYYYFNGILEENGVTVTTINCVYNIVETTNVIYTYIGVFRYNNEYLNPFLGTIYGDTNFLGTILVANLSWDSGTDLTDKTEYADKTNGILYLYSDDELVAIGGSSVQEQREMKRHLSRIFTIPNIVVFLSALYICFQIYELPPKVRALQDRLTVAEKEIIILKEKMNLNLTMLSEVRADVKQILKDVK